MKIRHRLFIAITATLYVNLVGYAAEETYNLRYLAKPDDKLEYKILLNAKINAQDIEINATVADHVKKIEKEGNISIESQHKIQKVKVGTQDLTGPFLAQTLDPVTITFGPLREVIDIQGKGVNLSTYRMAYSSTLQIPEKPIKIGEKWSVDFKPNTKVNFVGGKANYELLGLEKLNSSDALKLKWNYKEAGETSPIIAEGTAWLDPKDGSIMKITLILNNAPIAGLPIPLNNVKFIQERVK